MGMPIDMSQLSYRLAIAGCMKSKGMKADGLQTDQEHSLAAGHNGVPSFPPPRIYHWSVKVD
jgi:hypothetical protein